MPWLRVSLTVPLPGNEAEVQKLFNDLESALAPEKGFVMGAVFTGGHELGRFSLWESREDADRASSSTRIQAIRSQIHNLIQAGHQESLYEVTGVQHNLPAKS